MNHLKMKEQRKTQKIGTVVELLKKCRSMILYLVFGICTTLINLSVYPLCYYVWGFSNTGAVCVAWFIAVSFAFITNKIWVFERKDIRSKRLLKECIPFLACRIITGTLDLLIMYVVVDILGLNAFIWKILSSGAVVVLNYVAMRFVIFRKGCSEY